MDWLLAGLVAITLSICEAGLLSRSFSGRPFLVEVGFFAVAVIVQTLLLISLAHDFRAYSLERAPVQRFSWFAVAGAGLVSLIAIIGRAAGLLGYEVPAFPVIGRFAELVFLFSLAAAFALCRLGSFTDRLTAEQRRLYPIIFLAFCIAGVYFINSLLPSLDMEHQQFVSPKILPVGHPISMDFTRGVYLPAKHLVSGGITYPTDPSQTPDISPPTLNNYPPLVMLIGVPYLVMKINTAVLVHSFMLFLANCLCLWLAVLLARESLVDESVQHKAAIDVVFVSVFILSMFLWLSSYPYLFAMERGNIDLFAAMFSLLAMWVLLKYPSRIWLQVILLSIAVHIKISPVLLFGALFFVHGAKVIIPAVVVNTVLLFIAGPANAFGFVDTVLYRFQPAVWVWNHSGYSFAGLLVQEVQWLAPARSVLEALFPALAILVALAAWYLLLRSGNKQRAVVLGAMITVPAMSVLLVTSIDYQLVILAGAILLLLSLILLRMCAGQGPADYLQILLVSVTVLFLTRSYLLMPSFPLLIRNKYPWVLLLQVLMFVQILQVVYDERTAAETNQSQGTQLEKTDTAAAVSPNGALES